MLHFIADILICFFAVIGITLSLIGIFDIFTARKTGLSINISIIDIKEPKNCEYDLLILQSLLKHSPLSRLTQNIVIPKNVTESTDVTEDFFDQHKVFRKEE